MEDKIWCYDPSPFLALVQGMTLEEWEKIRKIVWIDVK